MMNWETQLKLQAYLDHELSQRESEQCATWVANDPDARALCTELSGINALLKGNELEFKLPETREFYWGKIEKAITQEPRLRTSNSFFTKYQRWIRLFAPSAGLALLLVTAIMLIKFPNGPASVSHLHEIEVPREDTSAISFYSQSAGMTVVWVQTDIY
jgi:hypothetical protein